MRFESLTDLCQRAPTPLGTTDWIPITEEDVLAFAKATRAEEWIHVDRERAVREGPFGTPVAHGFLTLSLATYAQTQFLDLPPGCVGVNYGVASARFPSHVPVGASVRASGQVVEAQPVPGGARVTVRLTFEVEGGAKPACVADVISLVVAPPDAATFAS
jgi:acyl dehydratase